MPRGVGQYSEDWGMQGNVRGCKEMLSNTSSSMCQGVLRIDRECPEVLESTRECKEMLSSAGKCRAVF